jgi:hypothetical protein
MSKPLIAKKEVVLKFNVKVIWDIVVNNSDYKWRSDIKNVEILENRKDWIEYYDENRKFFTKFTLKNKEECTFYSFDMENKNFHGNWIGNFIKINNNETKCIFMENIYLKNSIMNLLAKIFWNINELQEKYFRDLENKLKEINDKTKE